MPNTSPRVGRRALVALGTLCLLAACGTFQNDAASRVPAAQRAVLVYRGPSAGVSVSHVDGQNRGIGLYDRFDLAPGLRTVTVFLNLPGTRSRPVTIEFQAEPGREYELLYSTHSGGLMGMGGTWRTWIVDAATRAEVSRPSAFVPKDLLP